MRGAPFAVLILAALSLSFAAGCAAPEPPPPVDITGATAAYVRFAERGGEEIEVRGLRYRRATVVSGGSAAPGATDLRRDESRRVLTRDELARVIEWAGDHDVLTLASPAGTQELPTLAEHPPITLEVEVGESAIGIGWASDSTWTDPAMESRVRAAVASLRALADGFDRAGKRRGGEGAASSGARGIAGTRSER